MKRASAKVSVVAPTANCPDLARSLRDFAAAADHIHDLKTFVELFKAGLVKTGLCAEADLLPPGEGGDQPQLFAAQQLTMPIVANGRVVAVGRMAAPTEKHHFDAEDLHLLGGLSELLGAAFNISFRLARDQQALATLKAILSLAPVGLCAVDDQGQIVAINTLAATWLAVKESDAIRDALPSDVTTEQFLRGTSFHLRVGGRLLFCQSRMPDDGQYAALVITDLTPEQGRFLDAVSREFYRAKLLRRPLQFVILEQAKPGVLLAAIPTMRGIVGRSAVIGPYDATRVALVFPESHWSAVVPQLRRLQDVIEFDAVRVGHSQLSTYEETPEGLIHDALTHQERLPSLTRPRVLVHDGYGAVGDALKLVLGDQCDVTGSTDPVEAQRLVEHEHFDAVLADSMTNAHGLNLIATAKAHNRQVRGFLLSSMLHERMSGQAHATEDVPVFSKPFNVELIRDQILASLSSMHVETQK